MGPLCDSILCLSARIFRVIYVLGPALNGWVHNDGLEALIEVVHMITRRGLFGLLAAAIITPEELIEEIVKPQIFMPPTKIFVPETVVPESLEVFIPSLWSDEIAKVYKQSLIFERILYAHAKNH
jgi:hypothetical protein